MSKQILDHLQNTIRAAVLGTHQTCTDALFGMDALITEELTHLSPPLSTIDQIILLVQELGINELDGLRDVLSTRSYRMKEKEASKFKALASVA